MQYWFSLKKTKKESKMMSPDSDNMTKKAIIKKKDQNINFR